MCGRFFLATPGPELARHFGLAAAPELPARFNVAPGQPVPLVRVAPDSGERVLEAPLWGLVPPWADDPRAGPRPINARAESAPASPLFRGALAARRGLVPADGFYEWQHVGRSARPFAVRPRAGGVLALAAVFEHWRRGDQELTSCAILTVPAAGPVAALDDRMPLVVAPRDYARWLDPELRDPAALAPLLAGSAVQDWITYPVDRRVNDVREDDPRLLEPERDLFSQAGAP